MFQTLPWIPPLSFLLAMCQPELWIPHTQTHTHTHPRSVVCVLSHHGGGHIRGEPAHNALVCQPNGGGKKPQQGDARGMSTATALIRPSRRSEAGASCAPQKKSGGERRQRTTTFTRFFVLFFFLALEEVPGSGS